MPARPFPLRIDLAQHFHGVALIGKRTKTLFSGDVRFEVARCDHRVCLELRVAALVPEWTWRINRILLIDMRPLGETRLPLVLNGIEAVCFDAFGTLVEITDRQQAFMPLFRALPPGKRQELKHRLMREDRPFTDWPEALGVEVDPYALLDVLNRQLGEMLSVTLQPGMADIWARFRKEGLRLVLCSNLASDYVQPLRSKSPDPPDVEVLSCKVGAIKPEPAIYAAVLDGLQIEASRVLFVGDTPRADIEGPRAVGMRAIHVDELVAAMQPG